MGEHFLQWINIVDFKCFHNFEAKDFKRVNLISGKNNVGKTAFMETCYINVFSTSITSCAYSLTHIKFARESANLLAKQVNQTTLNEYLESNKSYHSKSNTQNISFESKNFDGIKEYHFLINQEEKKINSNDFSFELITNKKIEYIDNFGLSDKDINKLYISIQEQDHESELNKFIQQFDSSIDSFKVIGDKPQCKFQGEYIDLTEFGDGLKHYISIICALYACENGQLFIDEIDNGIHYTQLKNMWELILNISKEVNCQVFATTHSKECIESYARAAKRLEDQEIAFIELGKNKNNEIKAITMDYDRLQNELENTNEVRGW